MADAKALGIKFARVSPRTVLITASLQEGLNIGRTMHDHHERISNMLCMERDMISESEVKEHFAS